MFSFVGDTVLDPFMGTGTTNLAAAKWGRNSIGVELTPNYFDMATLRLKAETASLFSNVDVRIGGIAEHKANYVVTRARPERKAKRRAKTTKATRSKKSSASKR
jgi:DNA modification methylase